MISCRVKDPTCQGDVSLCPGNFWQPKKMILSCPCDYAWDQDLESSLASIQRPNVQVADLIDFALLMNPTTQLTWANARASAYGVGIAESALYPDVVLDHQLTYEDTEFDDGAPLVDAANRTAAHLMTSPKDFFHHPCKAILPSQLVRNKQGRIPFTDLGLVQRQNIRNVNSNERSNRRGGNTTGSATMANSGFIVGNTAQGIGSSLTLTHDLSISYLIFDFGGREASIEAAKQALYYSNWTHNRQIQQVIISVLQAYYHYIATVYLLKARDSDLENAKKNYEAAKVQFEVGTHNKLDVLQAETQLINIELSIVQLTGQKEILHGVLANALGLPANASFHVPEISHFQATDVIRGKIDQMIEEAISRRPDLAAAYAVHAQRKAEVVIARSQGLPKLGALVDLQEFNDMMNGSFNTHSVSGTLMLSTPIFSGYLYTYQERQAQELVRAACANIRNMEINITFEIVESYVNFKTAVKSLDYSEKFLKFSEETYEAALLGYQMGVSSILDLLAAQQTLSEARARLIQARTQWAVALSNLSFAIGTTGTEEELKPWQFRPAH